jgi:hypothetical protein
MMKSRSQDPWYPAVKLIRNIVGVALILAGAWLLFMTFGFAILAVGDLEDESPEWWPRVLKAIFGTPETYIFMAAIVGGVALCLNCPAVVTDDARS